MPRSYWRILFAIIGVVTLALILGVSYNLYSASEQQRSDYQYQPARHPALRVDRVTKTPSQPYQPNCQNPGNSEDADLCSQWANVDQVIESNRLSSVNLQMAVFSMALTLLATIFLVWTFWETRETSRRELRAYVHLKSADLSRCADDEFPTDCAHPEQRFAHVVFRNYGSTPAHNVEIAMGVGIMPFPLVETLQAAPDEIERVISDLPQGRDAPMPLEVFNSGNMHDTLMQSGWGIYYWGTIRYEDIFGRKHKTSVQLVSEGQGYRRGMFRPVGDANKSD